MSSWNSISLTVRVISALGFLAVYGYRGKQKDPLRKGFPISKGSLTNRSLLKSLHRKIQITYIFNYVNQLFLLHDTKLVILCLPQAFLILYLLYIRTLLPLLHGTSLCRFAPNIKTFVTLSTLPSHCKFLFNRICRITNHRACFVKRLEIIHFIFGKSKIENIDVFFYSVFVNRFRDYNYIVLDVIA